MQKGPANTKPSANMSTNDRKDLLHRSQSDTEITSDFHADFEAEYQALQQRRMKTLESTKQTTQNCVRTLAETEEIARNSMVTLDAQGNQITNMINTMDTVHDNMNTSDRLLRGMGSLWGSFSNMFIKPAPSTHTSYVATGSGTQPNGTPNQKPRSQTFSGTSELKHSSSTPSFSTSVKTQSTLTLEDPKEKQLYEDSEKDLDLMIDSLGRLKQMAAHMGNELDNQKKNIDTLTTTVDHANARVNNNIVKIRKI